MKLIRNEKNRISCTIILFCILCCTSVFAQNNLPFGKSQNNNILSQNLQNRESQIENNQDKMQSWMSKFYRLSIVETSKDGNWVVAKKWYDYNSDTTMVIDIRKPNNMEGYLVKKSKLAFLKDHILLASGTGQAEFWNFLTDQRKIFKNVAKTEVLTDIAQFSILDREGILTIYDENGIVIKTIKNVKNYISDGKRKLYLERRNENRYEIFEIGNHNNLEVPTKGSQLLYSTKKIIERFELSLSGKQLIVTEKDAATEKRNLVFISTMNQKLIVSRQNLFYPLGIEDHETDFFKVSEIQNGEVYLIESQKSIKKAGNVEIWYGNDGSLRDMQFNFIQRKYWLWHTKNNTVTEVPSEKFTTISEICNSRYFLAFNKEELQNYVSWIPDINMHLYDAKTNSFVKVDTIKPLVYTKSGKWMLYPNIQNKWVIYNLSTQEKKTVGNKNLKTPVFSFDEKLIYFESENDVWEYDIKKEVLRSLNIGPNKKVEIVNKKRTNIGTGFNFFQNMVENSQSVLFKVTDFKNNEVSIIKWINNQKITIVNPRMSTIKNLKFDENMQKFCFVEENFNMPSKIVSYNNKTGKELAPFENERDEQARSLKQEILHYRNAEGTPLKGTLYYPANFDKRKKYPMVVRIYQVQSNEAIQYQTPGYNNPIGFDLRAQLERGFFVLMPDIIFTQKGTGLSALECVNQAMDEVGKNENIDMKKVALMGHSHGGYETNFIATHSNRFATYISGAGNSDIIRSYFSYNYNFYSPFYWQFENGQYEMNTPFSEDKGLYIRNNPIYHVEKVNAPILLWAGKQDENIAWDQVMEFYIGLKRNKKETIALFYPEKGHDLEPNTSERRDLHTRVLEWLDYFLRDKKDIDWINKQMNKAPILN